MPRPLPPPPAPAPLRGMVPVDRMTDVSGRDAAAGLGFTGSAQLDQSETLGLSAARLGEGVV